MKNNESSPVYERWYTDLVCIAFVFALNPLIHFFNCSRMLFSYDTIAYLTLARDLFSTGLLYIPSWGHVDYGLLLPPLYPVLIGLGNTLSLGSFTAAEWVTASCALAALIPIYFHLKKITNRAIAVVTIVLIEMNYYYFLVGMTPLSESVFLLTLGCTFYLALRLFDFEPGSAAAIPFLMGIFSGLVFLSRKIGIIVFVFLIFLCIIQVLGKWKTKAFKNILLITVGWAIIASPYAFILYFQTGQHPFQQKYIERVQRVTTTDPRVLAEIDRINAIPEKSYAVIYAKRRLMRKLLPDSSEMYCYLDRKNSFQDSYLGNAASVFTSPSDFFSRLFKNILYLKLPLGGLLFYSFLLFSISPFLVRSNRVSTISRLLLPGFFLFYLLAISIFTSMVPRYIYVIFPFALIQISAELFLCFDSVSTKLKLGSYSFLFFILAYLCFFLTTPRYFTSLSVFPKADTFSELEVLEREVRGGPVFSLMPFYAYLAGGTYRILPNDSLEKVVRYGRKTGVPWLLIVHTESIRRETGLHTNASWYWEPSLEKRYPHLVRLHSRTTDGVFMLYEIRGSDNS